jgi:hypothetical protein
MISRLARDDFEDLKAQGLNPTLEDFDRLNQLALRIKDGAETTCANFPRVGWAADVPFFEPTIQVYMWYNNYAVRCAANPETENTFWAFALAHAREPGFFENLKTPRQIESAVAEWAEHLPATRDEVVRACRYATRGFDDAEPGTVEWETANPRYRAERSEAARNLADMEKVLARSCAMLHVAPDAIMHETPSRLNRLCESAAVELGKIMKPDEAQLRAGYDLALREIMLRLKGEKDALKNGKENHDGDDKHNA